MCVVVVVSWCHSGWMDGQQVGWMGQVVPSMPCSMRWFALVLPDQFSTDQPSLLICWCFLQALQNVQAGKFRFATTVNGSRQNLKFVILNIKATICTACDT
jgi:hypothetical protein